MNLYQEIFWAAYRRAAPANAPHDPWAPMPPIREDEINPYLRKPIVLKGNADLQLGPLPRYSNLAIHVKSAIYGFLNPSVQHMVDRNRSLHEGVLAQAATA